jgi:HK97 family phage prohead protease
MDVDREKRTVKCVWSRLGNTDLDSDIIVASAFTKTIAERGPMGKKLIWSLVDHRPSLQFAIGKPKELYIEADMLIAVTDIVDTEIGEDMIKLYDEGLINQHSIGFSTIVSEYDKDRNIRTIKELMLYEGSCVCWGANPETPTLEVFKSLEQHKTDLTGRLERLSVAFKHGTYTDATFSLMELEIKQIQAEILALQSTKPAEEAALPQADEKVLKALQDLKNKI